VGLTGERLIEAARLQKTAFSAILTVESAE
jgi:hypothetical protein